VGFDTCCLSDFYGDLNHICCPKNSIFLLMGHAQSLAISLWVGDCVIAPSQEKSRDEGNSGLYN
jgi:hypothetical protein